MKLLKAPRRNAGDGKPIADEIRLDEINFSVHKFNVRKRPQDKKRILIITCFSEFGCESLSLMYCIPAILNKHVGYYVICVGWYGREYLYRHLVDEYWEVNEEFQYLRESSDAFRNTSKSIIRLEKELENYGNVYCSHHMGQICLGNTCMDCNHFWGESGFEIICPQCKSSNIQKGLLNDIKRHKKFAIKIPRPSIASMNKVKCYLGKNPVGVVARGRMCYGRNLPPDFYKKLVKLLEDKGYTPIWLGEKQSVLPCPVPHIVDFSQMAEARDLELTLAIISQLNFTIQFWTASTRLASMVDTPWILFESPDQIYGDFGQEGIRIALTTDPNKKKIVLSDYCNTRDNEDEAIKLADRAIDELNFYNYEDMFGLVENPEIVKQMRMCKKLW